MTLYGVIYGCWNVTHIGLGSLKPGNLPTLKRNVPATCIHFIEESSSSIWEGYLRLQVMYIEF